MKAYSILFGAACCLFFIYNVSATVFYVDENSSNPVPPYANWSTASTDIQSAIDASSDGDLILVTNGVYATGGRVVYGSPTNRVVINKAVTVQSVNGPAATMIQGYQVPGATNGDSAVRCVYMTNNAVMIGFTLESGATRSVAGNQTREGNGGGVWCESTNAVITNCVIAGNSAYSLGGGAFGSTLKNCVLQSNSAGGGGGSCSNTLINCLITGNTARGSGGGGYQCLFNNCILSNNVVPPQQQGQPAGGGARYSVLNNCLVVSNSAEFGGGAANSTLNHCNVIGNIAFYGVTPPLGGGIYVCIATGCLIAGNSAGSPPMYTVGQGGGDYNGILYSCILSNNTAGNEGGGSEQEPNTRQGIYGMLNNCLVISNTAGGAGGIACDSDRIPIVNSTIIGNTAIGSVGGVFFNGFYSNCIIYYNTSSNLPSTNNNYYPGSHLYYCSTTPLASGTGNITNEPLFLNLAGGDYHLQSNSPCINAGNNSGVSTTNDLDGNPRIVGGTVDMGCYEYQTPSSVLSYAWAQQYGLPTDGTADYADSDGDHMNNYAEWKAGTIPTNAASVLALYSPATTNTVGITVTWQSVSGVTYYLQGSTNLSASPAFISIQSNLVGQVGSTSYTDTSATNRGPYFYRVGVQ
jgi:hypothetical protein